MRQRNTSLADAVLGEAAVLMTAVYCWGRERYHDHMHELVLVRHAKSDWGDATLADHDRPLNGRGRANAPMMAARFVETNPAIQRIISSTAVRAHTTALEFGAALGLEVALDPGLYLSSARTLLARALAEGVSSVMLVAHDPGITVLANELSGGGIQHMPTCAVARFTWGQAPEAASTFPAAEWIADTWHFDTVR